jgi:hypothetical protein
MHEMLHNINFLDLCSIPKFLKGIVSREGVSSLTPGKTRCREQYPNPKSPKLRFNLGFKKIGETQFNLGFRRLKIPAHGVGTLDVKLMSWIGVKSSIRYFTRTIPVFAAPYLFDV